MRNDSIKVETLMKEIVLCLALTLAVCPCLSQPLPFVEEGKIWHMVYNNPEASDIYPDYQFYYFIKGDTLISGRNCKKMYVYNENNNDSIVYLMSLFETERKVFFIPKDSTISFVLYDFSIPVGATATITDAIHPDRKITMRNNGEKDVDINGLSRHCCLVNRVSSSGSEVSDFPSGLWIEGVGSELGPLATWQFEADGNNRFLSYCDANGQWTFCLSELKDNCSGIKIVYGSKEDTKNQENNEKTIIDYFYDLQGRKLQQAPQKGIYIQNGKKKTVK